MTTTVPSPTETVPTVPTPPPGGRVVVGMDDNPVSVEALRVAAREAAYRGADVLAVHVWHYPTSWGYPIAWSEDDSPAGYIRTELARTIAAMSAERAAAGEPLVTITADVVEGIDASALNVAAKDAALLVLGSRHHNRLLGSVSQACINHPVGPILLVPTSVPRS